MVKHNCIWKSLPMVLIFLLIRGDCKEECMSALKLQAVGNIEFDLKDKALKTREKCIQNAVDGWILQVNDTEAGISLKYPVKCQQGCQHCNDESHRPYPPQEITYTSTTGSDLCFRWKGSVSTNYTMYYTQNRGYCSDMKTRCTADRLENDVLECCPQNLHPVAPIYVRIDYENEYMYVYGILYWLRAQTIAIPNPLKTFTYQLLDDTTVKFMFEDPEDWNFYSFSLLDKRICQKLPPVEEGAKCKTKTFQYPPNSWTISGLSYDTQYIYTAQCYRIEGRWSEEKNITFRTGGSVTTEMRNTSTSKTVKMFESTQNQPTSSVTMFASTQNQPTRKTVTMFASTQNQPTRTTVTTQNGDQNKVPLYAKGLMILAGFLIAAAIVVLLGACRWMSRRLFWKIPEPSIPPVIKYHCVDSKVPEVFDELRTRNEKLSINWNNGVDSGQGTSEGTLDESGFIDQYTPSQPLNGHVSVDHMTTHQVFIHKNSDDSDEECMGSNHGDGVGIGEVSFQNLIYENNLLVNENMGRKLGEYVNDDNSNSDDDDGDDSGDYDGDSTC